MASPKFEIRVSQPCFVIGEVAQAHDGSLGFAHAFIDVIARAGANAVKFQMHIADEESSLEEPWRVQFSKQDKTRFDYWRRMEFTEAQWMELKNHAESKGLVFLCSPFSLKAVDILERMGIQAWKVASGEVTFYPMLDVMAKTRKPVLLSSGMSGMSEISDSVERVRAKGAPVAVFQCATAYPCPPEQVGLNVLQEYRKRFQCPVGLSDHSGKIYPGLAAAAEAAEFLEVHVTMSRDMFGPDVSSSVTTEEFGRLIEGIRFIETMRANPVDKDLEARKLEKNRRIFMKSIFARRTLAVGEEITENDIAFRKPGTGIPANAWTNLLGLKVSKSVAQGEMLMEEHFSQFPDSVRLLMERR